jgi:signal transduction histidine kinase
MIFRRATLRLAASFASVQLALFVAFAVGVYLYVTTAFDFDVVEGDSAVNTAEAGFTALRNGLLISCAVLVLIVPPVSYALAALALRPVRASYDAQQRFVDDASHELRTPLTAIQSQLELALDRPRGVVDYLQAITLSLDATVQLNEILDGLLILSRGAHPTDLKMVDLEAGSAIESAMAQLSPGDRRRLMVSAGPTLRVKGDLSMLSRAVLNLVVNGLRYSNGMVHVEAIRRADFVRIAVIDSGRGMTAAERMHAFDRFWRADASRSSDGNGLGLPIVDEIARLHGGKVDLVTTEGAGTTIWMDLPLSR